MKRPVATALGLLVAIVVIGAAARAETAPTPAAEAGRLDEVIVTAQRREESAQDIGIALSVLSGESLKDRGVDKVNGLQNVTPSFEVEPAFGSGQPQFRLRGVGFIDYTSNNSSPVGVNVDEVALPLPIQTQGQLFDINRVEVLRGPQGTLYGRNTTGGAVNFISNRPTADAHGGVSLEFGSHDAVMAEGFLSGPLAEGLRGRLSVATEQGGAWQRNRATGQKLGDKDKVAVRGQLEWDTSATLNLRLTVHASRDKSDAYGMQLFTSFTPAIPGPASIPADTSPYATGWSLRPSFARSVGIAPGSKPGVDNTNDGADLTASIDLGGAKLTSITAYNKLQRRELGDWDGTSYAESDIYFHDDVKVLSEEARLASTGTGPFGWLTGVYYSDEKLAEDFYGDFAQRLGGAALTRYGQNGKSLGIFAQGNYRFTDSLKGILGLRHEHETRELVNLDTRFSVTDPPDYATGLDLVAGGGQNRSLSNSDLSGKAALEYQPSKSLMLYGSVSRGVKSGGFTAHNTIGNPHVLDAFLPEKLTAFEVGLKTELASPLRVNAAVFYYDYKDQQILSKYFDTTSQSYIGRFVNAPKSRITGAEVELDWQPIAAVQIEQYLGYKTGKYTDTIQSSDLTDFNGRDIDFPKLSYGGELAYSWSLGGFSLKAETNYSYHDRYPQLFLLGPLYTVDAYWLANAGISLAPAAGKSWRVALLGRNITDQKYYLTKNYFLPGTNIAAAGEPTTIGIRLDWAF
jgi:iron complex outermembrane receptor protein